MTWMRSLQARIVLTTVVLMAVVCAVVGIGAALSLRHYLGEQLAQEVSRTVGFTANPPNDDSDHRPPPPDAGSGIGGGDGTSRIEVRSIDGQVVSAAALGNFRSADQPLSAVQVAPVLAVTPDQGSPGDPGAEAVTLPGLGTYFMEARTVSDGSVVAVGISTARMDATVGRLAVIEIVIFAIGVAVAGVIAAFATGATLRPLHRVSATARRVSELPLERGEVELDDRVPEADADPRTEVGQVGVALNRMLGHVAGALEVRQESETRVRRFVADASHELRTPLAAIRGYSELARRRSDELPPEVAAMLERVGSQTERMTLLVEDLLLLARLDAGRPLARERVDLARIVADVVADAHAVASDHHWSLQLPEDPEAIGFDVVGDPERLHQVVANLLANARTHTPSGTHVVAGLSRRGDTVRLEVSDDGPGIAPDLLGHVFERFARGDTGRARTTGSTGLGLSIVSAVVTEHGGTLGVTSVPGDTRFAVALPAADRGGPSLPPVTAPVSVRRG
ncbi:HAMP domain-containing histidine kinase [Actinomycetospora endophytica]|uniref:histidine kinase n=1 Tax=Actinomycetospora endophytica TaxID=2291215 RepID=A0ABS8P6V4_9PSEU|nr:HAMP domain-containing sensor histidine kinase [Actinomycetospora endophytica]MCD2193979.1 HAMP domain-containing histidine kinase [Actinomycetospora endophytica]